MASGPLVSIVIPVYNGTDFLREAIDSALAQTYPNVEILVVDDGSSDGGATSAISKSYGDRIRYLHKENGGVASALNLGIREMRGEYFSWLSHDDVYLPAKLASQVGELTRQGGDTVLYADYEIIDEGGKRIGRFRAADLPRLPFRWALTADAPVNGCTMLVPARCFEDAGIFDERLKTTQDYDLWFRMANRFRFVHMPEAVLLSRVHAGQGTRAMSETCIAEGDALHIGFLEMLAAEPDGGPSFDRFLLYAAVRFGQRGYAEASARAFSMHIKRSRAGGGLRGFPRIGFAHLIRGLLDRRPFRGMLVRALRSWAFRG